MGKVITINKKILFPDEITETLVTKSNVKLNGYTDIAQTKFQPLEETLDEYKKYKILFMKKCNIGGFVNGYEFDSFLRKYETYAYENGEYDYVFTVGNIKGVIPRAALKRLKKTTPVKCSGITVDLVKAILLLIKNSNSITINSGWFSNLGTDLRNAWLQGQNVDKNPDWIKFQKTKGSKLKNIELKIEDDDFNSGYILMSLSSRGFLHTNSGISDGKFLEIAKDIITVIEDAIEISDDENDVED